MHAIEQIWITSTPNQISLISKVDEYGQSEYSTIANTSIPDPINSSTITDSAVLISIVSISLYSDTCCTAIAQWYISSTIMLTSFDVHILVINVHVLIQPVDENIIVYSTRINYIGHGVIVDRWSILGGLDRRNVLYRTHLSGCTESSI